MRMLILLMLILTLSGKDASFILPQECYGAIRFNNLKEDIKTLNKFKISDVLEDQKVFDLIYKGSDDVVEFLEDEVIFARIKSVLQLFKELDGEMTVVILPATEGSQLPVEILGAVKVKEKFLQKIEEIAEEKLVLEEEKYKKFTIVTNAPSPYVFHNGSYYFSNNIARLKKFLDDLEIKKEKSLATNPIFKELKGKYNSFVYFDVESILKKYAKFLDAHVNEETRGDIVDLSHNLGLHEIKYIHLARVFKDNTMICDLGVRYKNKKSLIKYLISDEIKFDNIPLFTKKELNWLYVQSFSMKKTIQEGFELLKKVNPKTANLPDRLKEISEDLGLDLKKLYQSFGNVMYAAGSSKSNIPLTNLKEFENYFFISDRRSRYADGVEVVYAIEIVDRETIREHLNILKDGVGPRGFLKLDYVKVRGKELFYTGSGNIEVAIMMGRKFLYISISSEKDITKNVLLNLKRQEDKPTFVKLKKYVKKHKASNALVGNVKNIFNYIPSIEWNKYFGDIRSAYFYPKNTILYRVEVDLKLK